MGDDGVKGVTCIKEHGGICLAQDEATCVVYGMPKGPIEDGIVDSIVPLENIATEINRTVK